MFKHSVKALSVGAAIVLATTGAWAQTPSTATPPTTVGVTPQEAREATQKAVPRADTGTLVRTEISPADRAKSMADDPKNAVTPNMRSNGSMNNNNANPSEPRSSGSTTGTVNNTTTPSQAMGITGTVPGTAATTGDATNTRNNPGTATGRSMDTTMDNNNVTNRSSMNNANTTRRNNRPARADRN